jgi:hypothetical protein
MSISILKQLGAAAMLTATSFTLAPAQQVMSECALGRLFGHGIRPPRRGTLQRRNASPYESFHTEARIIRDAE